MNYKYVVVTVIDREPSVEFAETLERAKEIMQNTINGVIECKGTTEEELILDEFMEKYELSAWITFDDVDFDISIFEIKGVE